MQIQKYHLPPTKLIPNSPYPLLHYQDILTDKKAINIHNLFKSNGWETQWIFRYGQTQESHYHSTTHECMAVLSGTATIRFGVADTSRDLEENTHGLGKEDGGIEIQAKAGDVFILPAGLAHKTFDTTPGEFALLSDGKGHGVSEDSLKSLELNGFVMIGAYPVGGQWDFATGGENAGEYEKVWAVPKPQFDPVLGNEGLCENWVDKDMSGHPKGEERNNFYSKTIMNAEFFQ